MFPTTLHTVIMKAEEHELARAAERSRLKAEARALQASRTEAATRCREPLRMRMLGRARIAG